MVAKLYKPSSSGVVELDHPVAADALGRVRNQGTNAATFRREIERLTFVLGCQATADLPAIYDRYVRTPIGAGEFAELHPVALVPVLRAGLGMVDAMLQLLPEAKVFHLGFKRDEETTLPIEYYRATPKRATLIPTALILDPMLATGGSIIHSIDVVKQWGIQDIRVLSILASEKGIENVRTVHPDVRIFVAAIDPLLTKENYIAPGLGDAGDRMFRTAA